MKRLKVKKFIITLLGVIITASIFVFIYFNHTPNRPNVLLITVDALRPDHLGCYGYERDTSPNIDKLAKEGVMFTQAISQGSQTIPSVPALMTSLYPSQHGIETILRDYSISHPVLAQILKKNGYYTGTIVAHCLSHTGLGKGFNLAEFDFGIKANVLTQKAINFLHKNKDKNFFLWLHYMDVHGPYRPPPPYNKTYLYDSFYTQNKNISISTEKAHNIYQGEGVIPFDIAEGGITEVEYYIAQYDGGISFADEQIGVLLEELEELGLDRKTIIILTADHGEAMGEHNIYFNHGGFLYNEFIKVPLIFKYSNILPTAKVINHQIGLIDVMPTILDLLGIQIKIEISGISLLPMILKGKSYPSRIIFSENFGLPRGKNKKIRRSLMTEGWKLIYNSNDEKHELYNLKTDPKELVNLAEIEKEKSKFLKRKLDNYIKQSRPREIKENRPLDRQSMERLKSLGYLQ